MVSGSHLARNYRATGEDRALNAGAGLQAAGQQGTVRRIAVVPAYNEEPTVARVLEQLYPLVDELIVVDDGSRDDTRAEVLRWMRGRDSVYFLPFDQNRGMSEAYYAAFQVIADRVRVGELSPDDIILTVDADGQHDISMLDRLVAHLLQGGYDAVIARRNLSGYPLYKRLGNALMSWWATLWSGHHFHDVESGYRAFRAGALLDALRFYKGYKYSETVEVAVLLPRMGYRVSNDLLVPVPVYRSRTRIKDVIIDLITPALAVWRYWTARQLPEGIPRWLGYTLPALVFGLLLGVLALIGTKAIYLGMDSVNNYAHVWYLNREVLHEGRLPLHMDVLENGRAVTFPYGFVPWLTGALLYEFLRDRAVTLLFVAGVIGLIWAATLMRPRMRDPWLLLLFLLIPPFIEAFFVFQFSFMWSTVFFFLFVWAAERRRWPLAILLLWLSISTHPLSGLETGTAYVCYRLWRHPKQRCPLLLSSLVASIASIPFIWLSSQIPALTDERPLTVTVSVLDNLLRRAPVPAAPFALTALEPWLRRHYRQVLAAAVLGVGLLTAVQEGLLGWAVADYGGIFKRSHNLYAEFIRSDAFLPGANYRLLEPTEREDGAYYLMQAGGRLAQEFFTESLFRRDWTPSQYTCFIQAKAIDVVIVEWDYLKEFPKNEPALLLDFERQGILDRLYDDPAGRFVAFDVRPLRSEAAGPFPLRRCRL